MSPDAQTESPSNIHTSPPPTTAQNDQTLTMNEQPQSHPGMDPQVGAADAAPPQQAEPNVDGESPGEA
ncbi:hypothetical protein D9619_008470 [Psilocybe cf. subviscida]|uniref:Uncharacterized protein n=1 Tax=Psilocybe cf. subviscida TaxID=2480587 RepID=A0A8H5BAF8_9AGAR|nr:hypothetical protein D9619_008470 [Psilocybe cf. subviscida]